MKKYLTVFGVSFQNEFTYRLNFILWRFRFVLRIVMTFFLWNSIFSQNKIAFGYSREQMFAYVFLVLLIYSFVVAAPSNDNIGGEISSGDLSNFLVKPMGYLRYWLTRDWASKLLNGIFALFEVSFLWFLLRPQITLTSSPVQLVIGFILCFLATIIYYLITKLAVSITFWNPEDTWSIMFLIIILMETTAGIVFPLDILPKQVMTLLQFTPFPYLVYYPIAVLVGRLSLTHSFQILFQSLLWFGFSSFLLSQVWRKGLKVYSASGK